MFSAEGATLIAGLELLVFLGQLAVLVRIACGKRWKGVSEAEILPNMGGD